MAILRKKESTDTQAEFSVNNGDLQALQEVVTKFGFVDEEAAFRFALFVLLKAEKNVVYVNQDDKLVTLSPTKIKPSEDEQQTTTN